VRQTGYVAHIGQMRYKSKISVPQFEGNGATWKTNAHMEAISIINN